MPNVVHLSLWDTNSKDDSIAIAIAAYEKEHPTIQIDRTSVLPQEFYDKLRASVEHPPDILVISGGPDPIVIRRGLLADLTKNSLKLLEKGER